MKLAAIVIIYNPEKTGIDFIISNINTYAKQCGHVYLVDNSPAPHSIPLENATYIHNANNGGIGGGITEA